jgi:hypothetical protein
MRAAGELVQGERRGRWLAAAVAVGSMAALWAAPARATDYTIPGSPLTVYANDAGQLQVAFAGSATGEFYPGSLAPASAGVNVAMAQSQQTPPLTVYGVQGSAPLIQDANRPSPGLTGDGSVGNPYTLTLNLTDGASLHLQQVLTYVNGSTDVGVKFTLQAFDNSVTGRLFEAADLYVAGNDEGVGSLDPGPPLQVGGINAAAGSSARLVQGTPPWTHYQESFYSSVYSVITGSTSTAAPSLSDTINSALGDNDLGVQWDFANVSSNPPGQVYTTTWRFKHFTALQLGLTASTRTTGQTATVTVAARNADGNPDPGRAVRYAIDGANPGAGTVTTGADGTAAISWTGTHAGTDTLMAFTDLNGNGVRDGDEPQQATTVIWNQAPPPAPPVPGKSVVVKVVSGQVFIKLPGSGRARATGPAKGFVPFTGAANIPVGSQLDTSRGRVALTSAADTGGAKTQTADFYQGIFQVKQALPRTKPKRPAALITDLVMKGQIARSQCAPLKGARAAVAAAKKKKGPKSVLGKLWGNGKGKFRTSGKYSSATVRGTVWLVEDRCDGTLTKVSRGTVSVRDIKRRKTVIVKAGHSYLARAQRASTKSKRP